jgi:hypothetical protein
MWYFQTAPLFLVPAIPQFPLSAPQHSQLYHTANTKSQAEFHGHQHLFGSPAPKTIQQVESKWW